MIKKYKVKVLENKKLTSLVHEIQLEKPKEFKFIAGQHVNIPIQYKEKLIKEYSIASAPHEPTLKLCIKRIEGGVGSNYLCNLKQGDEVEIVGPLGSFKLENKNKKICFISTGTGISPFLSMIKEISQNPQNPKLKIIHGYRNKEDILYQDELNKLNIQQTIVLSSQGAYVQDKINPEETYATDFYICGLKDMITDVKNKLIAEGVKEECIFIEQYD